MSQAEKTKEELLQEIQTLRDKIAVLEEKEEYLRILFDAFPDTIVLLDPHAPPEGSWPIVDCNPTFCRMNGYSRETLIGKPIDFLHGREEDLAVRQAYYERLKREGTIVGEVQHQHRDGRTFDVQFSTSLVQRGGQELVLGIDRDITARKQTEQELQERALQLALVNEIGQQLAADIDLKDLLGTAARLIQQSYDYPHVAVFLREGDDLVMRARAGEYADKFPPDHRLKLSQGMVGWAASEGQLLLANDVRHEPRYYSPFSREIIRSEISLPLKVGEETLGVLDVQSQEPEAFGDNDVLVLSTLADQLAVAIQNAELFAQVRTRAAYLASLNHASARVSRWSLDLKGITQAIVSGLTEEIGLAFARIWMADPAGKELVLGASAGLYTHTDGEHARLSISDAPACVGCVIREGKPLLVNNVQQDGHFDWEWAREQGIVSYAGYPPMKDDKLAAVLGAFHTQPLEGTILDVMGSFVNQTAVALENARLYSELENYSIILEQAVEEATVEVRRSKERVETILTNSPDPILLLKPDGTVEAANRAFSRVFGYDTDEAFRQPLIQLLGSGHQANGTQALQEAIHSGQAQRSETIACRKDGTTFDADVALAPIQQGPETIGLVCSIRDISAFKEVERMKDAFVSNVSHELRTPITGLKLNYELLNMDPERRSVYYERLGREIGRLNLLIEDLLRLSRLDQGRVEMKLAPSSLNELAIQYVDDRAPLAERQGLKLVHELQPHIPDVQCDCGLLGQALSVLLTNAINYTPSGGTITVRTHVKQDGTESWVGISVSDTGLGITAEDLAHLFDRFFRGKVGRDSGAAGTGLGLAIAKEIVEHHNGHIEVESEGIPGRGATFTLWIPALSSDV